MTADPTDEVAVQARARFRVIRGGEPTAEETAALAVTLQLVFGGGEGAEPADRGVAADEWALQGRLNALRWQPMMQRWPGEPPGRSWRRILD